MKLRTVVKALCFLALAAMAILCAMVAVPDQMSMQRHQGTLDSEMRRLHIMAQLLRDFRRETGVYPTQTEGFSALLEYLRKQPHDAAVILPDLTEPRAPWFGSKGILIGEAGGYSSRLVALMYENRQGAPAERFAASPVNADSGWQYSLEVDTDVYLYSLEAIPEARALNQARRTTYLCYAGEGFGLLGIVGFALRSVWFVRVLALLVTLAAFGFSGTRGMIITCYLIYSPQAGDERLLKEQERLLEEYRIRGAISAEAQEKIRERIRKDQDRMRAVFSRER